MRLFRISFPRSVVALIVSEILLIYACFLAAIYLVLPAAELFLLYEDGLLKITIAIIGLLLTFYFQDLYTDFSGRSRIALVQHVIFAIGITFVSQAVINYIANGATVPPMALLVAAAFIVIIIPLWRITYRTLIYRGLWIENILFLGTNPIALQVAERVEERPELGFKVAGFLDNTIEPGSYIAGAKVLGPTNKLKEFVAELKPDRVVVSLAERRNSLPVYELLDLRFAGVRIEEAATMYQSAFGRVAIQYLRPSQLIFTSELGPRPWGLRLQAMYSFLISLIGIILASPLMLLVALAVRITSPGPALYRQTRVGLHGVPFTIYKFRSMNVNAEAKTGAVWATKHDPRITPVGRFIRLTRLDELPQLFNVLKGEMSIVGPRPERPEFVKTLSEQIPFYQQRHSVRPGLTGWAQINYKYGDTIQDTIVKLEYDLHYVQNLSFSLDVYIMFQTIKTMLLTRGAH